MVHTLVHLLWRLGREGKMFRLSSHVAPGSLPHIDIPVILLAGLIQGSAAKGRRGRWIVYGLLSRDRLHRLLGGSHL